MCVLPSCSVNVWWVCLSTCSLVLIGCSELLGLQEFDSTQTSADETPDADAVKVLTSLKDKAACLVAIVDSSREAEKSTRVWIEKHLSGVFEKIAFVGAPNDGEDGKIQDGGSEERDSYRHTRQEIYADLNVEIAVAAGPNALAGNRECAKILVHEVPTPRSSKADVPRSATDWRAARNTLEWLISLRRQKQEANLVPSLPTLGGAVDLIAISARRSPGKWHLVFCFVAIATECSQACVCVLLSRSLADRALL